MQERGASLYYFAITMLLFVCQVQAASFEPFDANLPVITIENPPGDTTLTCDQFNPFPDELTANDDCPGNIIVSVIEQSTRSNNVSECDFYTYEVTRIYTLSNDCDDNITHVQIITVVDTIAPVFDPPANITVQCQDVDDLNITGRISPFADLCGSPTFINFTDEPLDVQCTDSFDRIWTVTDVCGNRKEERQTITLIDTIAPEFVIGPLDVSVNCNSDTNPFDNFNAWVRSNGNSVIADNCNDISLQFAATPGSYNINDPTTFPGTDPGVLNDPICGLGDAILQFEEVHFVLVDACGNASVDSATYYFIDDQAPDISDCAEMRTIELNGTSCDTSLIFDIPVATEGCVLSDIVRVISDEVAIESDSASSETLIVNGLDFTLGPFGPEIEFTNSNFFIVRMNNVDADHPDEVFEIYSEDDQVISTTINTSSECGDTTFLIGPFSLGTMNSWSADDFIEFKFVAKPNPDNPSNSINDICIDSRVRIEQTYTIQRTPIDIKYFFQVNDEEPVEVSGVSAGQDFSPGENLVTFIAEDCVGNQSSCTKIISVIDNVLPQVSCSENRFFESRRDTCRFPVQIEDLIFVQDLCNEETQISISITGPENQLVEGNFSDLQDSIIEFAVGASTINVIASDFSGNQDQCNFEITVADNEFPFPVCENAVIPAIAVELDVIEVDPELVAGNSTDNCGIAQMVIQNNNYSCFDLNVTVGRTVSITDNSGNTAACTGNIFFDESEIPVNYSVGLCSFDSLKFEVGINQRSNYTYRWEGPNNFFSAEAEPFILGAEGLHQGTYTVTVTNTSTICQSFGSVDVDLNQAKIPIFSTDTIACQTLPHRLESTVILGDVFYIWNELDPEGLLVELGTSSEPFIDLFLEPGMHELLVTASDGRCPSERSNTIMVDVRPTPEGAICATLVEACLGDPLVLCVDDPQPDWIIKWTGPENFESNEANAVVTDSFESLNSGVYNLVIESNLCVTDTFTTAVSSNTKPPTPQILGQLSYCDGDSIRLESSVAGVGYIYSWHTPAGIVRTLDPEIIIPVAESIYSGVWNLSIELDPCVSDFSADVNLFIESEAFEGIAAVPTQCNGSSVQFDATEISGGDYLWIGPGGFNSSDFAPVVEVQNGVYALVVTSTNGCRYEDQIFVNAVDVPEIINIASDQASECIDPLITITLTPEINASAGATYKWTGPGISSIDPTLSITNFTSSKNGKYSLVVSNGDCDSEPYDIVLDYIISPIRPIIGGDAAACVGDSLTLISNLYDAGSSYLWNTPNGVITTDTNRLELGATNPSQEGQYSLMVSKGSCTSLDAEPVNIAVEENNFTPTIFQQGEECLFGDLKLFTNVDPDLILEWELPNGNFLETDTLRIDNARVFNAGNYRVRSFFNGCPSDWSTFVNIDITDPREGISLVEDFIFTCNNEGAFVELCVLDEGAIANKTFLWYTNGALIGETADLCFPLLDFSPFSIGVNQIELKISYNDCISDFDQVVFLEIEDVVELDLDAGPDQLFCVNQELTMSAEELGSQNLEVYWDFDENVVVSDFQDPNAIVQVINDVPRTAVIWTVEHEECGVVYRDSVILIQKVAPMPVNDTFDFDDTNLTFNPLENDILIAANSYELSSVSTPKWGDVSISGDVINFDSDPKFVGGAITFEYTVCDLQCDNLCGTGTVIIYYNQESCKGNNVLTANNDGINDRFIIPCIDEENLPDNELTIINELGNKVFEQSPYDNSWEGTFNGESLPEGTYYYLFRKNQNSSITQGFIAIER